MVHAIDLLTRKYKVRASVSFTDALSVGSKMVQTKL